MGQSGLSERCCVWVQNSVLGNSVSLLPDAGLFLKEELGVVVGSGTAPGC